MHFFFLTCTQPEDLLLLHILLKFFRSTEDLYWYYFCMKLGFHRNHLFLFFSDYYVFSQNCASEPFRLRYWNRLEGGFNIEKKLKPKFYEANWTAKRAHKRSEQVGWLTRWAYDQILLTRAASLNLVVSVFVDSVRFRKHDLHGVNILSSTQEAKWFITLDGVFSLGLWLCVMVLSVRYFYGLLDIFCLVLLCLTLGIRWEESKCSWYTS